MELIASTTFHFHAHTSVYGDPAWVKCFIGGGGGGGIRCYAFRWALCDVLLRLYFLVHVGVIMQLFSCLLRAYTFVLDVFN